jgi:putative transposase
MKSLRRLDVRNTLYFVTVVTLNRQPVLADNINIFWQSWNEPPLGAWVILPDHFHAIIDIGDKSISDIIHDFKIRYSIRYRFLTGSGKIWQNRFWDHAIRNEKDLERHLNYIHFNPVKHGIVSDPFNYQYSSINQFYYSDSLDLNSYNVDEDKFSDFGE